MEGTALAQLVVLEDEIRTCRRCDAHQIPVEHLGTIERGSGSTFMVVGVAPGKTEAETGTAFSGKAGQVLMDWLGLAGLGNDRTQLFQRGYFTSLCKCRLLSDHGTRDASRLCFPFLARQLELVRPSCLVTLGLAPLRELFEAPGPLETLIGGAWTESDLHPSLFPLLPPSCKIVPLPHPSPRSLWLNKASHRKMLRQALGALRLAMEQ